MIQGVLRTVRRCCSAGWEVLLHCANTPVVERRNPAEEWKGAWRRAPGQRNPLSHAPGIILTHGSSGGGSKERVLRGPPPARKVLLCWYCNYTTCAALKAQAVLLMVMSRTGPALFSQHRHLVAGTWDGRTVALRPSACPIPSACDEQRRLHRGNHKLVVLGFVIRCQTGCATRWSSSLGPPVFPQPIWLSGCLASQHFPILPQPMLEERESCAP